MAPGESWQPRMQRGKRRPRVADSLDAKCTTAPKRNTTRGKASSGAIIARPGNALLKYLRVKLPRRDGSAYCGSPADVRPFGRLFFSHRVRQKSRQSQTAARDRLNRTHRLASGFH